MIDCLLLRFVLWSPFCNHYNLCRFLFLLTNFLRRFWADFFKTLPHDIAISSSRLVLFEFLKRLLNEIKGKTFFRFFEQCIKIVRWHSHNVKEFITKNSVSLQCSLVICANCIAGLNGRKPAFAPPPQFQSGGHNSYNFSMSFRNAKTFLQVQKHRQSLMTVGYSPINRRETAFLRPLDRCISYN